MDGPVAAAPRRAPDGVEREGLQRALTDLRDAVGDAIADPGPAARNAEVARRDAELNVEDERGVVRLRAALDRLAIAAAGAGRRVSAESLAAVQTRLNASESVMRRKILVGQRERLPQLVPSFVFLALQPLLGRTEAMRVSGSAAELFESRA